MKTIRTIFAILFLSSLFIACEAEAADDQVQIEDIYNEEDSNDSTEPESSEDSNGQTDPHSSEDSNDTTDPGE